MTHAHDLIDFIAASPSAYHAAHEVARQLDFELIDETQPLPSTPGGYSLIRGGAVLSWYIPDNPRGFKIIGAHTDSPSLQLKPDPDFKAHGFDQVAVEVYGGPILETWFDRELTVAGRVVLLDGTEHLVDLGPCVRLPNLAIHLGREKTIDKQHHINPISSIGPIMPAVAASLGVSVSDIAGHELFCVDSQRGEVIGDHLAAGRLDNLSSVFAGLKAMRNVDKQELNDVVVLACFNHEEVGSASIQGAGGPLLEHTVGRIAEALGRDLREMLTLSSQVSADAAHSVHPNYPAKHDEHHLPLLGKGPVIKINSKQRYASDAVSEAMFVRASGANPYQRFVGNNEVPCGSTIGPISATRLGISTVDVGVPLLAMHSTREMVSVKDQIWLSDALEAYLVGI